MAKLICKIFGHSKKVTYGHEMDAFGYEYVWQPKYCARCGERISGERKKSVNKY